MARQIHKEIMLTLIYKDGKFCVFFIYMYDSIAVFWLTLVDHCLPHESPVAVHSYLASPEEGEQRFLLWIEVSLCPSSKFAPEPQTAPLTPVGIHPLEAGGEVGVILGRLY